MDTGRLESENRDAPRTGCRRLLALHGLALLVGLVVPLVLVAGLADWLIHLDAIARLTFLVAVAGFAAWLAYRYVIVPLIVRFADLDIAMRIEERWPGLNDRLASTVQFLRLRADDDRFGSAELRDATVRQTVEQTKAIDFREVVESKPLFRSLGLAFASITVAVLLIAVDPALASIAARRFFAPFGSDRWPQQTHLALIDGETPRKIARGEPFTLGVMVGEDERAPSSAKATYTFEDGESTTEALRAIEGGIFRGRIEVVEKSFTFSVIAGDDSTSIRDIAVKVVPPPAIDALTIRLVAPPYTKLPPQTLAAQKTQVKSVEGTTVVLSAQANKPIEVAALRLGEKAADLPVKLDPSGKKLSAEFTLKESGPFWFELKDTEGFRNREATRYEMRAIRDEAPRVVIDDPANDRDVPSKAVVPVTFTVDDDFGINTARIVYKAATGGSEPLREVVLPLWDSSGEPDGGAALVKHKTIKYAWDLAPLNLPPGSMITFHADARDFDAIKGPNLGKSREIHLRVVTDEEVARQLDDARRAIREDIEAILNMQNQARTPVDEALRSLKSTDQLPRNARENLKNAEMIQRQVGNRITNKADGLGEKIDHIIQDYENFKVENPDAKRQMEDMKASVARVRENNLEPAEQGLTRAAKNLDNQDASAQGASPQAKDTQNQTKASASQKAVQSKSSATAKSKSASASKSSTDAGQPKGAEQGTSDRAADSSSSKGKSQPKGQTGDQGRQPQTGSNQRGNPQGNDGERNAAEEANDSLGEAQENQKAIAEELKKMLEGLSEFETFRGVGEDVKNTLKEHEQVMKQSADLASKPELNAKSLEQLTQEQKNDLANVGSRQAAVAKKLQGVQEEMQRMAEKLKDSDPLAAEAMRDAAEQVSKKGTSGKIGEAADALERNQMGSARSNQEQARDDLKELVNSLQNRRERELAKLIRDLKDAEAELNKLRQRQTENLKRTRDAKKMTDPVARSNQLKKLAKEQAELQKQAENQLKKLSKLNAENASRAAARAAGKMGQAQQNLDQDEGEQAERQEDEALADLEEAEREARETRKEAEEQLAMEQLSKMGDHLKSLAERQEKVGNDTKMYDKLRQSRDGKFTVAQRSGVRNLSATEEALKDETGELIEKLEGAPVFALTLKRASERMKTAADRLQSLQTDDLTQRAADSATNRFKQLLDSLKPDKPKNGGQQQQGEQGEQGESGQRPGLPMAFPPAAQIKMLKSLQEEINERTEFYDELGRRGKQLTPEQTTELERLHQDQGTLADLVRDLTKPKKSDAED